MIGVLPTLVGAEYTFSFQNMNIERGLLWNQENAITRGVQINQTMGKFTASFSWNDGYYSNRYSGLSGSLTYTKGPHSIAFVGAGYLGQTNWTNLATPIQNNGQIYDLIYTYTKEWLDHPALHSIQRRSHQSRDRRHPGRSGLGRCDPGEPHLQERMVDGRAL